MKWISISKRLPKEGKEVLVYAPNCNVIGSILIGICFKDENTATWTVYDFHNSKLSELVTHWMPLPKKP